MLGFNTGQTSLFGNPTATPASSGGLFSQQNASMGANTGSGIFGTNNPNSSFGQSKPVGTGFSFGAPAAQTTNNIFGAPQTSTAGTGMFGTTNTGIVFKELHFVFNLNQGFFSIFNMFIILLYRYIK